MGGETTGPGSPAPVSSSERPRRSGHGGSRTVVGSRSHIPVHVKESFGCFSLSPRGRKVPTAITAEQPTLEGPLPRTTSSLPGCVRPLAPTPQPTLALPDATSDKRFPCLLPWAPGGLFLPAGHKARWTSGRLAGGQERAAPAAGRTPPWAPACSGPAPPSPWGAVPQVPVTAAARRVNTQERRRGRGQTGSRSSSARHTQLVGLAAGSPPGLPHLPPPVPGMMTAT